MKEMFLIIENVILVEYMENDYYWGDGGDGFGKNCLGKILMKVRDEWNFK